ncbi:MAG: leucine-rich repeat protein, partial [bacterium]|nr:leucine-rich repeat protein [bacterium]
RQYYPVFSDAKVYETSEDSECQGYSNTKDKVREHNFGKDHTDEICDYCCEIKNINYPGLSAECSEITYDGKSHTPEITIKAKKAEGSGADGSGDSGDSGNSVVDNSGDSDADSSGGSGSSGNSVVDNSGDSGADNSGDLPEDAGSLTEGTDYEVSVTPQTDVSADANGYTATITGKGAYAGTRTVQWNLTPKEITLTVDGEVSRPYDGTTDVFLDDILTNITTSLDGVLEEDKNDVSAKVSYAFADANANDSVVVNVTKAILEGNKSINYTLAEDITNTITGHITKLTSAPALPQQQERKVAYTVDTVDKVTLPAGWEWAEEDKTKSLPVGETITATAVYAGADKGNYETVSVEIAITRQTCTHEGTWDDGKVTKQPTEKETGVKTYTCTLCGETRTEEIPVVKPSDDNGNGASDSNDTSNGTSNDASKLPVKGSVVADDQKTGQYQILNPAAKEVVFKGLANKNAKSVTIPATVKIKGVTCKVTGIADNAMKGSKKLTKAVIGSNVKTIGKNAFAGSKKLKTVKIGKNVTSIGANAFKKCTAVTSLTLPAKTVKIGANAFNGCKKLKKLTIKSKKMTKKTVAKNAFKGLTKKTKIKAPKAKVKAYKKLLRKRGLSGKVKFI